MSGCEERASNEELKSLIKSKSPDIEQVEVESDTVGPLYAASDAGKHFSIPHWLKAQAQAQLMCASYASVFQP